MESKEPKVDNRPLSVTYRQLGCLIVSFLLGGTIAILISNARIGTSTYFSTTELIGFSLTVILSGAATVLAIAAIALGKSSEQAVIKRSDESIHLQNEVFVRTNEALQRIKASTGVTEKRIEDIISGRVGDISQQVAERATEGKRGGPADSEELEELLRQTILEAFKSEKQESARVHVSDQRRLTKEATKDYRNQHQALMKYLSSCHNLQIEKSAGGVWDGIGDELFDGLLRGPDFRLGVATFMKSTTARSLERYLARAITELANGTVDYLLAVAFSQSGGQSFPEIDTLVGQLKDEMQSRILVVPMQPENINSDVQKLDFSDNRIRMSSVAKK